MASGAQAALGDDRGAGRGGAPARPRTRREAIDLGALKPAPARLDGFDPTEFFGVPSMAAAHEPVVFFERAQAVWTPDGQVVILLLMDLPSMEPGFLLTDVAPSAWLRTTGNGLERLRGAVLRGLELAGRATD